jgi:hypothetical protein
LLKNPCSYRARFGKAGYSKANPIGPASNASSFNATPVNRRCNASRINHANVSAAPSYESPPFVWMFEIQFRAESLTPRFGPYVR